MSIHEGHITSHLLTQWFGSAVDDLGSGSSNNAVGDAQRSRAYATSGLPAPPTQMLWQLDKLFRLKFTEDFVTQNGSLTIRGELPTFQSLTAPIVADEMLFFTIYVDTGYFYAVDGRNGKQLVTLKFEDTGLSSPVALGQTVFFGTRRGKLYAYDVKKRASTWTYEQQRVSFSEAEPVIEGGVIYLCSYNSDVFAVAADSGAFKWQFKFDNSLAAPSRATTSSFSLTNR